MTTVLFVHGTGVRLPAYEVMLASITRGVAGIRPEYSVLPCYWGDDYGASLQADGACLPRVDSGRGSGDSTEDLSVARWTLLDVDPLFELRLLAAVDSGSSEIAPHVRTGGERLAESALALRGERDVIVAFEETGMPVDLGAVVSEILGSEPYLAASSADIAELGPALAGAIVASSMRVVERNLGGPLSVDGRHLVALSQVVVDRLGGSGGRSVVSATGRVLAGLASWSGVAKPLERRRDALAGAILPVAGDVLRYLAHGDPLRCHLVETIASAAPPVVVLAHSLGGIAALEALMSEPIPGVEVVITVGSQAPLLYEIGALPTLEFGCALPGHMPAWVNVVDYRDLLAFVAEPLFPGKVTDLRIDNRIGFPRAHSAYFGNDDFYALLDRVLP